MTGLPALLCRDADCYFLRSAAATVSRRQILLLTFCRRSVAVVLLYSYAAHTVYYFGLSAVAATAWYLISLLFGHTHRPEYTELHQLAVVRQVHVVNVLDGNKLQQVDVSLVHGVLLWSEARRAEADPKE